MDIHVLPVAPIIADAMAQSVLAAQEPDGRDA